MSSSSSSRAPTPNACSWEVNGYHMLMKPRPYTQRMTEWRSQETYLSRHSSSSTVSLWSTKQVTPGVWLRVEQVDVFAGPSALQRQAWVKTAVAQTLNSHLRVEVNRSYVFRGKGHVLRRKLIVILVCVEVRVKTSKLVQLQDIHSTVRWTKPQYYQPRTPLI